MDVESLSGEIGKCLQWLRKSLSLTQYQLATFTELDYRHFQNIESGRVEVKVETLKRVCSSFGITLSTFFYLLDRKPWLGELQQRRTGPGDLYLYRMIMEQAKFRFLPPVRDFISEWGRSIAEGNRESLKDCGRLCFEVDSDGRILWKNTPGFDQVPDADRDIISMIASTHQKNFSLVFRDYWESKAHSFYIEVPVHLSEGNCPINVAFTALRPMVARSEQTIFLAMLELGEEPLETHEDVRLSLSNANRVFM